MRRGARTVIERVRYDGVARCSRTFARDGAALVMLSNLGPGVVRGDRLELTGTVCGGAHLIVTEQTATRVLGGSAPSTFAANWTVEPGATLDLRAEPVVAHHRGEHEIVTEIDCAPDACVILRDLASVAGDARLRLRTLVRVDGRDRFYDALELGAAAPPAVGTFVVIGRALAPEPFDALAQAATDVRIGIGTLPEGLFARVLGPAVWPVSEALAALRATFSSAATTVLASR